jgi:hypothetical protein
MTNGGANLCEQKRTNNTWSNEERHTKIDADCTINHIRTSSPEMKARKSQKTTTKKKNNKKTQLECSQERVFWKKFFQMD